MSELAKMDAIIICVPTPLSDKREPDLSTLKTPEEEIAARLRPGQLVSLESTTYPGTTDELLLPRFEAKGLKAGRDFFLVFSPEREDPGRIDFNIKTTPKIVGGVTPKCAKLGAAVYAHIVDNVVKVSSTRVAEMSKLLENIYRSVNIALVNELAPVRQDGQDIWSHRLKTSPSARPFMGPGLATCMP
jgi:UDP-N-acetyl-D-glucosamine dehydrogenase